MPEELSISGRKVFFRFAWPCAKQLLGEHKIKPNEFEHGEYLIKTNGEPEIPFLEKCFDFAVKSYRQSCSDEGYSDDFSLESVINHWQYRHNDDHYGDCGVVTGVVMKIGQDTISVIAGSKKIEVTNPYGIELEEMTDLVLIHRRTIAHKLQYE